MDLKKIKAMPFKTFTEESGVRWRVTVREPIQDGTRLLVVDFLKNEGCTAYRREASSFRIVCDKKNAEVKGIAADGRITKGALEALERCRHEYVYIPEREERMLFRFLGGEPTAIDNLAKWVRKTSVEQQRRSRQQRGELMDEDYRLCPDALPDGLTDYIRQTVLPADKVLLYKKGNVKGLCYCCGRQVRAQEQRFRQHEAVSCPNCGRPTICVLEGSSSFAAEFVENVVIAQKGMDGQTVFFRQFSLRRDPTAQWEEIEPFLHETVRYAIRGDKTAKWQCEYKENCYVRCERYTLNGWVKWGDNRIYDGGYYFCPVGAEEALAGTQMQYADLQGYLSSGKYNKNPIYFLEYHAKYPVIEFLWKAGYRQLAHSRVFGMTKENRNAIRWQQKDLKSCFYFPLRVLKYYPPEEWTLDMVQIAKVIWQRSGSLTPDELRVGIRLGGDINHISAAMEYASIVKIAGYLDRQCKKAQAEDSHRTFRHTTQTYRDYLSECRLLQLNLKDSQVLFPADLQAAHNRTMAQVGFAKNKAKQEKFQRAADRLEKYAWAKDGYSIRPVRAQQELAEEGAALHHCVGGYIKRMADGESAIFFIRTIADPDKPYFTLELNPKTKQVVQCRTEHNRSYEAFPEVQRFAEEWYTEVVAKIGARKKKKEEAA